MKNKKARTLWNRALRSIDDYRIREIRTDLKIPENGFLNKKRWEDWVKDNKNDALLILNKLHEYRDEVATMSDSISVGFSKAIEEYIINGEVTEVTLEECDTTGCQLKFVSSDEATTDFPMGVYVQIGPHSSPTDVKTHLIHKRSSIDQVRNVMFPKRGSRPKSEGYYKNITIFWLGTMEREELNDLASETFGIGSPQSSRRDFLISEIMKKLGCHVSDDNVRRIISREQKKNIL